MIIKSRRYVIQGKVKLPSQVMVNPTGEITVLIQDKNRRLSNLKRFEKNFTLIRF